LFKIIHSLPLYPNTKADRNLLREKIFGLVFDTFENLFLLDVKHKTFFQIQRRWHLECAPGLQVVSQLNAN